ncbi:MAG: regulatory signaling modulator protein AmpE [Porticoccaceae bacterium]|nr:regulatory signaling modulator protein AmpE [Porticoccaceae bacterium]MEA3300674.1 regulatory signaling modulator protein AmpE [Pseudomonadota bacterium]HLS99669.1 regulatory signaling modulator protein AmpE [Porticoccaceae bacterium]
MTFLVLVIALGVVLMGAPAALQRDGWFAAWWAWLAARLGDADLVRLAVAVLAPVLGLALVLQLAGGWLFGLVGVAVNLAVLLYAFGRGDLDGDIRHYRDDLHREDTQAAWHDAAGLDARHRESAAASWRELHDQAVEAVAYRYFERYFPVLFWFLLLGAPGALLYRLAVLALGQRGDGEGRSAEGQLLWVLEWIPVRLVGLLFALVGNFAATVREWRETLLCATSTSAEVLGRVVRGALASGDEALSTRQGALEMDALVALYRRALILFLGLIALVTLLT